MATVQDLICLLLPLDCQSSCEYYVFPSPMSSALSVVLLPLQGRGRIVLPIVFSYLLFLDLCGNHHKVKERCKIGFIGLRKCRQRCSENPPPLTLYYIIMRRWMLQRVSVFYHGVTSDINDSYVSVTDMMTGISSGSYAYSSTSD